MTTTERKLTEKLKAIQEAILLAELTRESRMRKCANPTCNLPFEQLRKTQLCCSRKCQMDRYNLLGKRAREAYGKA